MKRIILASILSASAALWAQQPDTPLPQLTNEQLIQSLISNSPYGTAARGSVSEMVGISLRSAAFVEGKWHFSLVNKEGRSGWLALDEESEIFPCKITEFDEETMSVKAVVAGKTYELSMSDRASFANQKLTLAEGILPEARPRSISERRARWDHASEAQILEANNIQQRARAEGRAMTRAERARLFEIERNISVPTDSNLSGQQPQAPSGNARPAGQPAGGGRRTGEVRR